MPTGQREDLEEAAADRGGPCILHLIDEIYIWGQGPDRVRNALQPARVVLNDDIEQLTNHRLR